MVKRILIAILIGLLVVNVWIAVLGGTVTSQNSETLDNVAVEGDVEKTIGSWAQDVDIGQKVINVNATKGISALAVADAETFTSNHGAAEKTNTLPATTESIWRAEEKLCIAINNEAIKKKARKKATENIAIRNKVENHS